MDPEVIARDIIPRLKNKRSGSSPSVYLSIPSISSKFHSQGENLEALIERLLDHILTVSHPAGNVWIAVREKKSMSDLENFFSISPDYWFNLSIECQAESGFEDGAQKILESLGYRCHEWVGVENSESRLGAFHFGTQEVPALILYIQNHRARRNCDFLIPVIESVPYFAHAI